jgi:hypothetical protein
VESKWKNYHITTFPGQSLSKPGLSSEEAMDLSRDRQIEKEFLDVAPCNYVENGRLGDMLPPSLG